VTENLNQIQNIIMNVNDKFEKSLAELTKDNKSKDAEIKKLSEMVAELKGKEDVYKRIEELLSKKRDEKSVVIHHDVKKHIKELENEIEELAAKNLE
jgi:hypothetical protein